MEMKIIPIPFTNGLMAMGNHEELVDKSNKAFKMLSLKIKHADPLLSYNPKAQHATSDFVFLTKVLDVHLPMYYGLSVSKTIGIEYLANLDCYEYFFTWVWQNEKIRTGFKVTSEFFHLYQVNIKTIVLKQLNQEICYKTGINYNVIQEFLNIVWYDKQTSPNNHASFVLTDNYPSSIPQETQKLPGVMQRVLCPCGADICDSQKSTIWKIIQHLNDTAGWSREQIADWLDELHDTGQVNIEFSPWQEEEKVTEAKGWKSVGYVKDGMFSLGEAAKKTTKALEDYNKLEEENNDDKN